MVPQGAKLSDNTLLGVYSCSPAYMADQSTFLGSPAFLMENRKQWEDKQTAKPLSRSTKSQKQHRDRTYAPPFYLWSTRLLFNLIKIAIFPFCGWASLLLFIFLRSILYPLGESSSGVAYVFVVWAIGSLAILLTTLSIIISCILAKWLLVGRYTAGQHPMYSTFIWRVEWVYEFEELFERVAFIFQGSPYIVWMLRAYGMHIGRNVFLYNIFPGEFDLISIGDGATISRSVMQTHLYEDRMFKMGPILVGPGVAVDHGIVLYNSEMAEGSSLAPVSLVMRGERIEPYQRHFGLPSIPAVVPPPPKGSEELSALREVALDALREVARAELRYHEAARVRSRIHVDDEMARHTDDTGADIESFGRGEAKAESGWGGSTEAMRSERLARARGRLSAERARREVALAPTETQREAASAAAKARPDAAAAQLVEAEAEAAAAAQEEKEAANASASA